MNIYDARAYIIAQLIPLLDGAVLDKEIQSHRGQFASLDEIKQIAARSPAVRVAFRGLKNVFRQGPELYADVLWVIHTFASDKRAENRSTIAGTVAVVIADCIAADASHWPFAEGEHEQLTALDLSTLALDQNGVALWQITWSQKCKLQIIDPLAALTEFDGFDADHFKPGANTSTDQPLAKTHADYVE